MTAIAVLLSVELAALVLLLGAQVIAEFERIGHGGPAVEAVRQPERPESRRCGTTGNRRGGRGRLTPTGGRDGTLRTLRKREGQEFYRIDKAARIRSIRSSVRSTRWRRAARIATA